MNDHHELVDCPTCAGQHPSSVGTCAYLEAVLSQTDYGELGSDTAVRFGRQHGTTANAQDWRPGPG